ncbi:hypothetical protein [Peterkaempfera griseoplana]|uniref:hypothetical protein n=1 Tax=Peterkaempfera griseoplana TaxID=66896 RepID=UPI0006E3B98D|nr:hypothetical protein [Peterkaempfera griseoplana]
MLHDEEFERRLPAALNSTLGEFRPPPPDLAQAGAVRGRRMRRARAVRVGAVTAATALAAMGGTLLIGPPQGTAASTPGPARLEQTTPVHSASPSASTPAPLSGTEVLGILARLLPQGGKVSQTSGQGPADGLPGAYRAALTWTGPRGTAAVDLSILQRGPQDDVAGCLPVQVRPYDQCTRRTLADGSVLVTTKSFTYPSNNHGQRRWYVILTTPSHAEITVEEFAGGAEKAVNGNAQPALSIDQLSSIATSGDWRRAISSLPAPVDHPGVPTDADAVPAAQMIEHLTRLLPPGGELTDKDAGPDFVALSYNDGRGRSLVQVQVSPHTELTGDWYDCSRVKTGTCTLQTLSDGTKVLLTQGPDEKTGRTVVRQADVLHPDGRRVAVLVCNSYSQGGPVTRPEPALSLEQVRQIGLSPRWTASR